MLQRCINKQQTLLHLHTMQQVAFSIAMVTIHNSLQISPSTVNLLRHLKRLYTSIAALSCFLRPLRDHSSCLGSSQPPIAYAHASDLALVMMQRSHVISNRDRAAWSSKPWTIAPRRISHTDVPITSAVTCWRQHNSCAMHCATAWAQSCAAALQHKSTIARPALLLSTLAKIRHSDDFFHVSHRFCPFLYSLLATIATNDETGRGKRPLA